MSAVDWATAGCALVALVLLAALVRDRARLAQRAHDAEGAQVGLRLDLDAARERIAELQSYLAEHDSWDTTAPRPAPDRFTDGRAVGRWTPAAPAGDPRAAHEGAPRSAQSAEHEITSDQPG